MAERLWNALTWWQMVAILVTVGPLIGYAAWTIWRRLVLALVSKLGTIDDFRKAWAERGESRFAQEHRALTEAQQRFNQMAAHNKQTEKDKAVR